MKLLIGRKIIIVESNNKSLVGIKGTVVDETKNTITIENGDEKKIAKDGCVFEIDGKRISGKEIMKGPEERLK